MNIHPHSRPIIMELLWFLILGGFVLGLLTIIDMAMVDIKVNDYSDYRIDMYGLIFIGIIPLKMIWSCIDEYRCYSIKDIYDKR